MNHGAFGIGFVLWLALAAPGAARAEFFLDLRAGGAFTEDGDVELSVPGFSVEFETEYEDSVTGGMRPGYWFDSIPWLGVAGDVSYFAPNDDTGGPEIDVIPISPLLMLRAPLIDSEEFPNGRLHPFAGVGPGVFVSIVDFGGSDDDAGVNVGLDAHAGVELLVAPNVGIFVQYRYTRFEAEVEIQNVDMEFDLATHHAAAGIGVHF